MAQITPGDKFTYSTPLARYEGYALLVEAGRVLASLALVSTERVDGQEIQRVGRESTTPSVLPVADVKVIA
jgi:hypothetical protein